MHWEMGKSNYWNHPSQASEYVWTDTTSIFTFFNYRKKKEEKKERKKEEEKDQVRPSPRIIKTTTTLATCSFEILHHSLYTHCQRAS